MRKFLLQTVCVSTRVPSSCIIINYFYGLCSKGMYVSALVYDHRALLVQIISPRVCVGTRVPSSWIIITNYATRGVQSAHGMSVLPQGRKG